MNLEDLIRDGLDVEALPPGTGIVLHLRRPVQPEQVEQIREQAAAVGAHLGVKVAIVSHEFEVLLVPAAHGTVNGAPAEVEARR